MKSLSSIGNLLCFLLSLNVIQSKAHEGSDNSAAAEGSVCTASISAEGAAAIDEKLSSLIALQQNNALSAEAKEKIIDELLSKMSESDKEVLAYHLHKEKFESFLQETLETEDFIEALKSSNVGIQLAVDEFRKALETYKAFLSTTAPNKNKEEREQVDLLLADKHTALLRKLRDYSKENPEQSEQVKKTIKLFEASRAALVREDVEISNEQADKDFLNAEIGLGVATLVRDLAVSAGASVVAGATMGGGSAGAAVSVARALKSSKALYRVYKSARAAHKQKSLIDKAKLGLTAASKAALPGAAAGLTLNTARNAILAIDSGNYFCNYYRENLQSSSGDAFLKGALIASSVAGVGAVGGIEAVLVLVGLDRLSKVNTVMAGAAEALEKIQEGENLEAVKTVGVVGLEFVPNPSKAASGLLK